MAKRYDTVRMCPWCGNVPGASDAKCKCGMIMPKASDFEFGLKYLGRTSLASGATGDNVGEHFSQTCKAAVSGDEKAVKTLVVGDSFLNSPELWAHCNEGLSIVKEASDKGFKWATYCLGHFYFKGIGAVEKDYSKAKQLMLSAAVADPVVCVRALQHVCMCYFDGVAGFERDVDRALEYYQRIDRTNSWFGWATLAMMLDRTDLCKNDKFSICDGSGRSLISGDDFYERKKNFEWYFARETQFCNEGPFGFSFSSQTDSRQLMCLIKEACKTFKRRCAEVVGPDQLGMVLQFENDQSRLKWLNCMKLYMFDNWNGLVARYEKQLEKIGRARAEEHINDYLGNRLKWVREGEACAALPHVGGWKGRGLAFKDVYFYDSIWLGRKMGYDLILFSNLNDYLKIIQEKLDNYEGDLKIIRMIVRHYFKYLRRYILSDRKAGVVLWDGSIQTECNASCNNVPVVITKSASLAAKKNTKVSSSATKRTNSVSQNSSSEPKKTSSTLGVRRKEHTDKKRWLFILIGLFFGVIGLHFLYARRKGWFWFYWLMVIANVVQMKVSAAAEALGKTPYFGLVAGLMLVGSIFFMKKDGDGNRM